MTNTEQQTDVYKDYVLFVYSNIIVCTFNSLLIMLRS